MQSFIHELIFHQNIISEYWFDSVLLFGRNLVIFNFLICINLWEIVVVKILLKMHKEH